jgi:hypothetical protein
MRRRGSSGRLRPIAILAMAGWLAAGPGRVPASGQTIANSVINDFEIAPAGSLEWDILDRLASTHRYDPRDLFRLSRMTVLESIAMYENMRADLPETMFGAQREGEMSRLWDAAELFYVSVTPSDVPSLLRSRPLLGDVEAAYRRLDATLGAMPGASPQAALHLRNIARLLPVMNNLIDAMEADQGVPVGVPAAPAPPMGNGWLREQARGLVEDLRGVEQSLKGAKSPPAGRDALLADLDGLVDLVQGLDRMLADGAPVGDIVETLRLIRSRLWPIQARFLQLARTPGLAGRWQPIRERINGISDRFDRPRVIALKPAAATRPAAGVDRRLLAQADRAIAALDEFLNRSSSNGTAAAAGSLYQEELGQLRRRLLLFREHVAAGGSAESLSRSLGEIEDLNRRLAERARSEARVFRGNGRLDTGALETTLQVVEKLRESMPKSAAGAGKPVP